MGQTSLGELKLHSSNVESKEMLINGAGTGYNSTGQWNENASFLSWGPTEDFSDINLWNGESIVVVYECGELLTLYFPCARESGQLV